MKNNKGINVLSLFDGMSCGQIALKELGVKNKYYASEVDKFAINQTQLNFPETIQLGDVSYWREWDINWKSIDLVIGGFCCQSFSSAGNQKGFNDDRGRLFFDFADIVDNVIKNNPDAKFLGENVRMSKEHQAVIDERLGVSPVEINSSLVSAQNRVRLYWTNIKTRKEGLFDYLVSDIPQPKDRGIYLRDILDIDVPDNYYLSDKELKGIVYHNSKNQQKGYGFGADIRTLNQNSQSANSGGNGACGLLYDNRCNKPNVVAKTSSKYESSSRVYSISGKSPTINTCSGEDREPKVALPSRGLSVVAQLRTPFRQEASIYSVDGKSPTLLASNPQDKSKIMDKGRVRRLTHNECARLQTIPDWYKWECSNTQQYKMLGNGWTIEVIKHIFSFL